MRINRYAVALVALVAVFGLGGCYQAPDEPPGKRQLVTELQRDGFIELAGSGGQYANLAAALAAGYEPVVWYSDRFDGETRYYIALKKCGELGVTQCEEKRRPQADQPVIYLRFAAEPQTGDDPINLNFDGHYVYVFPLEQDYVAAIQCLPVVDKPLDLSEIAPVYAAFSGLNFSNEENYTRTVNTVRWRCWRVHD